MKAILALEDGSVLPGISIGVSGICCGEMVFNTAMTGYQEILSDPSYKEQIITFTYPEIGNVGVNDEDQESKYVQAAGVVIKQLSNIASNWRSQQTISEYLKANRIVGIANVDTRFITHKIREQGFLSGCIMAGECDEKIALQTAKNFKGIAGNNLISSISKFQQYETSHGTKNKLMGTWNIVIYDFGVKRSILNCLKTLGCNLTVVPHNTTLAEVLSLEPEGIVLSNGPGDPEACSETIKIIRSLIEMNIPLFGICLGYQLLALAFGATTFKMKFGHHGANHPVQDLKSKRVLITSQNHGFAVDENSLPIFLQATHRSLFDGSLQGFRHIRKPIFGFQGHPEAGPGPHDAKYLFQPFIESIKLFYFSKQNKLHAETN